MTEAHKHDDIFKIVTAFDRSIQELIGIELFSRPKPEAGIVEPVRLKDAPPVNGARLGRDPDGHPGWFVADKARAGKYLQVH